MTPTVPPTLHARAQDALRTAPVPAAPLRVALDIGPWESDPSGAGRTIVALVRSLLEGDGDLTVVALAPSGRGSAAFCLELPPSARLSPSPALGFWSRLVAGRRLARLAGSRVDILHLTGGYAPRAVSLPVVVGNPARPDQTGDLRRWALTHGATVIGPLGGPVPIAPPPSGIPALATSAMAAIHTLRAHWGLGAAPYFLSEGQLEDPAAYDRLLDAMSALPTAGRSVQWVLLGTGPALETVRSRVAASPLASRVRVVGLPDRSTVAALRAGAVALVQPESGSAVDADAALAAMGAGVPVLVHRGSAAHAVTGEAALVTDASGLRGALAEILGDERLRSGHSADGLRHSATFHWARTARDLVALYRRLLAHAHA